MILQPGKLLKLQIKNPAKFYNDLRQKSGLMPDKLPVDKGVAPFSIINLKQIKPKDDVQEAQ